MYRSFKTRVIPDHDYYYNVGKKYYQQFSNQVYKILSDFIISDGSIDGSEMQSHWFSEIDADIFISHSHRNEKEVISLAGYLYDEFELTSFIDSCIWGHSSDLLSEIDDKYCKQSNGNYSYQKRNNSTSHVHMMLSVALNKMMDNCECIIFYNTPDSINPQKTINETESPWIYSEISMLEIIQERRPERHKKLINKSITQNFAESTDHLTIRYKVNLNNMTELDAGTFLEWKKLYQKNRFTHPLDLLYSHLSIL